ncbi:hypothetical protein [Dissulfurispira sp.]|uniref:hypothetical protein n=1 Tax=Dissulfurispira sp. TaxID=2817609 RepID=UPI002FDAF7EA
MKIIFTKYLCPLSERISLLGKYGYYFDNARTPEDIDDIEQMLKAAVPDGKSLLSMFGYEMKGDSDPFL